MESVPVAQYETMSVEQQNNVCKNESDAVREFLANDSVGFRSLINQRIAALDKQ